MSIDISVDDQSTVQDTWDTLLCDVDINGTRRWFDENGQPHRENGPAIITAGAARYWCKHGTLHRENGPAIVYPIGQVQYYLNNCRLSEEEFNARKLTINK